MSKKIEYKKGEVIGGCIYLYETDAHIKPSGGKERMAMFKCKCGNEFETLIYSVKSGLTKSCGCMKGLHKHHLTNHKLHRTWRGIKGRCYNTNNTVFNHYGGRGIKVYDKWKNDFLAFYEYVIKLPNYDLTLTLDRVDNNGNYEPGNLRWATMQQQVLNRRVSTKNKYGFTGVVRRGNRWRSRITYNRNVVNIGSFETKKEAVNARNNYIIENKLPHKKQKI